MIEVSADARNVEVMATTARMNAGYLRVYGAPRPASPEVAVTSQTLFAECRFGSPAFGNPTNGTATANPITPEAHTLVSGVPVWFSRIEADGVTAVLDGDMYTDLIPDKAHLVLGGSFSVTSLLYSRP